MPIILYSNPAKQHTPSKIAAIKKQGFQVIWLTTIWYKPNSLLAKFLSPFSKVYQKYRRYEHSEIDGNDVMTNLLLTLSFFISKVVIRNAELRMIIQDVLHDYWVASYVNNNKIDFVIGSEKSSYVTIKACKRRAIPFILDMSQVHPSYIQFLRERYPFFKKITGSETLFKYISNRKVSEYKISDKILCLSTFSASTFSNMTGFFPEPLIIQPGVDADFFTNTTNRQFKNDLVSILYVGSITKRKGIHFLVDFFSENKCSTIRLKIIGNCRDIEDEVYMSLVNDNRISYTKMLSQSELISEYQQASLLVLPSLLDSWGMVVTEAMASGCPVLLSDTTGAKDIVSDEVGRVFKSGDYDDFRKQLLELINNPDILSAMSNNTLSVVRELSWDNYAAKLKACMT